MEDAVAACKAGMSLREASRTFSVPLSTLSDRLRGRSATRGRPPALSNEVETLIEEYVTTMAEKGFGVTRGEWSRLDQVESGKLHCCQGRMSTCVIKAAQGTAKVA